MVLKCRGFLMACAFGVFFASQAEGVETENKYFSISKVTLSEVSKDIIGQNKMQTIYEREFNYETFPDHYFYDPERGEGEVLRTTRDLVALGESIYQLVIKGKPTSALTYAPISVIPKVDGAPADIFDTENWSDPVKKSFKIVYTNFYGMDVVTFKYSVIYSANGSYNGTGAYLTAVQIIPQYVKTLFGFDFSATMKLGGIQNQGTKANPIAAATILLEHTVSSVLSTTNQVESFFVTGNGKFTKL